MKDLGITKGEWMKEIKLTQGKVALVDDEDYELVSQKTWYTRRDYSTCYAISHGPKIKGVQKTIFMHNFIMDPPNGMEVDHIDRNGLNCQRANLRYGTHQQNCMNQRPKNGAKYKGVILTKDGYICAAIRINGKYKHLGSFPTEELAALAYDEVAFKYYGEFAYLNFKHESIITKAEER